MEEIKADARINILAPSTRDSVKVLLPKRLESERVN
jgi:hypothetical protein